MYADLDNMLASDKFRAKPEPRSRDIEQKLSCTIQMTAEVYKSVTEGEAPLGADGPAGDNNINQDMVTVLVYKLNKEKKSIVENRQGKEVSGCR